MRASTGTSTPFHTREISRTEIVAITARPSSTRVSVSVTKPQSGWKSLPTNHVSCARGRTSVTAGVGSRARATEPYAPSGDNDAVAPRLLGAVERVVGARDQLLRRLTAVPLRHADRAGVLTRRGLAQALENRAGAVDVAVGQD